MNVKGAIVQGVQAFVRALRNDAHQTDVQYDAGEGPVTGQHFADVGDDSFPHPDDSFVVVPVQQSGRRVPVGWNDNKNPKKSTVCEKRIYGRDANGDQVNELWLRNNGDIELRNDLLDIIGLADGSANIFNDSGFIVLEPDGTVDLNGVRIDPAGNIVLPSGADITIPGMSATVGQHDHNITSGSSAPGPTTIPN